MSRQSEAKQRQQYRDPKKTSCVMCAHFKCDETHNQWGQVHRKNCRCKIGGFKVKLLFTCDQFQYKTQPNT